VLLLISYFRIWVGEKTQKDLGSGAEPVESFCDDIIIQVQIKGNDKAEITNLGNVPIYGVEIKKVAGGSVKKAGSAYLDLECLLAVVDCRYSWRKWSQ